MEIKAARHGNRQGKSPSEQKPHLSLILDEPRAGGHRHTAANNWELMTMVAEWFEILFVSTGRRSDFSNTSFTDLLPGTNPVRIVPGPCSKSPCGAPEESRAGDRLTLCGARKIMRGLGIRGVVRNAKKATAVPDPSAPSRPDLARKRLTHPCRPPCSPTTSPI